MSNFPVIVDAVRTPMGRGKAGGSLSTLHPVDLLSQILRAIVSRNDLDPATIDDVIIGCVSQVGEQSATPGRMAVLAAGFPAHVPSTTIDRKCGSSQQAVHFAAQGIAAGAYDIVIAGGVESMSRVPMGSARINNADPFGAGVRDRYAPGLVSQGVAAELVAAKWRISREECDAYAVQSHHRAAAAAEAFKHEITAIDANGTKVERDETIRPDSSVASLSQLKTVFADEALSKRFPQLDTWRITAGNSSQITDGAAAVLVMSEARAKALGLKPRARFVGFDVIGDDPVLMLTAPIPATRRVLKKSGMKLEQIDHYEINEAFAPVPLAWQRELGADPARLNPRGGAIALGHPLGASGARLLTTMLNALEQTGGRYGLMSMCEAGGMANATIIERL
jgi:acetyl-CoA acyltransferase